MKILGLFLNIFGYLGLIGVMTTFLLDGRTTSIFTLMIILINFSLIIIGYYLMLRKPRKKKQKKLLILRMNGSSFEWQVKVTIHKSSSAQF